MAFNAVRMLKILLIYSPEVDVFIFLLRNSTVCLYACVYAVCVWVFGIGLHARSRCVSVILNCLCVDCLVFTRCFCGIFCQWHDTMLWHVNTRRCVCVHQVCYRCVNRCRDLLLCTCVRMILKCIVSVGSNLQRSKTTKCQTISREFFAAIRNQLQVLATTYVVQTALPYPNHSDDLFSSLCFFMFSTD